MSTKHSSDKATHSQQKRSSLIDRLQLLLFALGCCAVFLMCGLYIGPAFWYISFGLGTLILILEKLPFTKPYIKKLDDWKWKK